MNKESNDLCLNLNFLVRIYHQLDTDASSYQNQDVKEI